MTLYYITLYYIVLYYITLHYIILYHIISHYITCRHMTHLEVRGSSTVNLRRLATDSRGAPFYVEVRHHMSEWRHAIAASWRARAARPSMSLCAIAARLDNARFGAPPSRRGLATGEPRIRNRYSQRDGP